MASKRCSSIKLLSLTRLSRNLFQKVSLLINTRNTRPSLHGVIRIYNVCILLKLIVFMVCEHKYMNVSPPPALQLSSYNLGQNC